MPTPAVASTELDRAVLTPGVTLYAFGACCYVTALVMANIIGVKLFHFDLALPGVGTLAVEHTAGMLAFPITFVLTDILNEYYGPRATRRVVYFAFLMALMAFALIAAARALPILEGIPGTATDQGFEEIFGSASLMYVASITAFLLGGLLDIFIFGVVKRLTHGRYIWLRATGSTVLSQLFDSFIVTSLFFTVLPGLLNLPVAGWGFVLQTALTGYVLKFVLAIALTPAIYLGRVVAERAGLAPEPVA